MSITAFPVLARIIKEKALMKTKIGITTLAVAAWDDVTAWILLALSISLVGGGGKYDALWTFLLLIGFASIMLLPVRILLKWLLTKKNGQMREFTYYHFAAYVVCMFSSAWLTQYFGLHSIFGAFIWGLVIPREGRYAEKVGEKFEDFTTTFFLPLYFTASGLRTQLGLLSDFNTWGLMLLIISVAIVTKVAGGLFAAKISGMTWRESFTLGILMNTKGLVELIVLNLGRDHHLISDTTFSMMVVMALVTTFLTSPFVHYLYPYHRIVEFEHQMPGKTTMFVAIRHKYSIPAATGLLSLITKTRPKKYRVFFARSAQRHEVSSTFMGNNEDEVLEGVDTAAKLLGMPVKTVEMPYSDSNDNKSLVSSMVTLSSAKNANFFFTIWRPTPEEAFPDTSSERVSFDTTTSSANVSGVDPEEAIVYDLEDHKRIPLGGTLVRDIVNNSRFSSNMCVLMDRGLGSTEANIIFIYTGTGHDAVACTIIKGMLHNPAVNLEIVVPVAKTVTKSYARRRKMGGDANAATAATGGNPEADPSLNASGEIDDNAPTRAKLCEQDGLLDSLLNTKRGANVSLTIMYRTHLNQALANHIRESNAGLVVVGSDLNWQLAGKEGVIHHRIAAATSQSFLFVAKCVYINGDRLNIDEDSSEENDENAVLLENVSQSANLNVAPPTKDQPIEVAKDQIIETTTHSSSTTSEETEDDSTEDSS